MCLRQIVESCRRDDSKSLNQHNGLHAPDEKGAKRCLRTHPSTVTAGLLPLGPDPVRLDPPRLETAFRLRITAIQRPPDQKRKARIIQADTVNRKGRSV